MLDSFMGVGVLLTPGHTSAVLHGPRSLPFLTGALGEQREASESKSVAGLAG